MRNFLFLLFVAVLGFACQKDAQTAPKLTNPIVSNNQVIYGAPSTNWNYYEGLWSVKNMWHDSSRYGYGYGPYRGEWNTITVDVASTTTFDTTRHWYSPYLYFNQVPQKFKGFNGDTMLFEVDQNWGQRAGDTLKLYVIDSVMISGIDTVMDMHEVYIEEAININSVTGLPDTTGHVDPFRYLLKKQ
jgi:hypothetical protein